MAVPIGTDVLIQPVAALGLEPTIEWTRTAVLGVLGYGLLACIGAFAVAFGYRATTVRKLPVGPAILAGLSIPAGLLTIEIVRHGRVVTDSPLTAYPTGLYLGGLVVVGSVLAAAGHRIGDHLARGAFDIVSIDAGGPVADLLRAGGLAVAVTLPESIDDATGYPAVDDSLRRDLAGRTFLLPGGVSPATRRSRLERRLETDYDLGYVHIELTETEVTAVTVGDRRTGISSTLGPGRVAVAIAADAPSRASAGDPVEIWTDDTPGRFVTTGTIRASSGSVTTVVVAAEDADAFDHGDRYRLTTRPETPGAVCALVSAIRATAETVAVVDVGTESRLESEFVGWLPGTVLAIDRGDEVLALPAADRPLEAGDTVYVFGTPDRVATLGSDTPSRPSAPACDPDRSAG